MSDKIQMTEEQANDFYEYTDLDQIMRRDHFIDKLKNNGVIRKSDLEILIEEAEEMHKSWQKAGYYEKRHSDVIEKLWQTVQAMKAELNKRRDI